MSQRVSPRLTVWVAGAFVRCSWASTGAAAATASSETADSDQPNREIFTRWGLGAEHRRIWNRPASRPAAAGGRREDGWPPGEKTAAPATRLLSPPFAPGDGRFNVLRGARSPIGAPPPS